MSSNMRRGNPMGTDDDDEYEYQQMRAQTYDNYDTEYGESKHSSSNIKNDRYSMYKAQVEADQSRSIEETRKPFVRNIDNEKYDGFHIGANLDKAEAQRKKEMERELYRLQLETDAYTKHLNDEDVTTTNRKPYVRNNADDSQDYGSGFTIGSTMDKKDMKRQKAAEQELYRLQLENDIYAKKSPLDPDRARSRPRGGEGGGNSGNDYNHPLSSTSGGGLQFGGQSDGRGSARDKQGAKDDYRRQLDMDRARKQQDYGGDSYPGSGSNSSRGGGGGYNSGRSAQQIYGGYAGDGGGVPAQAHEFQIGRNVDAGAAKSKRQADQELYRQQLLLDQEEQKLLRSPSSRGSARHKSASRHRVPEDGELGAYGGGGGGMQIGGDEEALRLEKRRLALEMLALNQQQSRDAQSGGSSSSPSRTYKARNNSAKGYHTEKASQIRSFEDAPGMVIGDRGGYGGKPPPRAPPAQPQQEQGGFMDLGAHERDSKDQKRRDALQDYRLNQQAAESKRTKAKEEQQHDLGYSSSYNNVGYGNSNSRHGSGNNSSSSSNNKNSGYSSARSNAGGDGRSEHYDRSPRKQSNATGYTAAKVEEMRKFEESSGGFQIGSDAANGSGGGAQSKRAQQAKYAMMLEAQQAQDAQYSRAGLDESGPSSGRGSRSNNNNNNNNNRSNSCNYVGQDAGDRGYEDSIDGMMRDRPYSGPGGHGAGTGTGFNIGGDAGTESDSRQAKQREYKRLLDKQKIEDEQMQRYEELKRRGGVF